MAKDGTNRGGARPGAGRPRKALTEKIAEGKSAEVMMQPADIESAETPPVRDFMKELQRDGTKLLADDVYIETYQWLKERSCEKIVSRQLVEQYAMSISRWIHCEQIVTKYGYISNYWKCLTLVLRAIQSLWILKLTSDLSMWIVMKRKKFF